MNRRIWEAAAAGPAAEDPPVFALGMELAEVPGGQVSGLFRWERLAHLGHSRHKKLAMPGPVAQSHSGASLLEYQSGPRIALLAEVAGVRAEAR